MVSGRKIREFILDETTISRNSLVILDTELQYFDSLMELILDFLNRQDELREGETKYYMLCSLCKTQIIKACINISRQHIGDAFTASRLAADAALYSLLMSLGRLSESEYMDSRTARDNAIKTLSHDVRKGVKFPDVLLAVRQVRTNHSPHAHADPISLANRIVKTPDGKLKYSTFQDLDDPLDFRYFFMGMLWVGGMCLRSFLYIQETEFKEDVRVFSNRLDVWKRSLQSHRRAIGVFPNDDNEAGF